MSQIPFPYSTQTSFNSMYAHKLKAWYLILQQWWVSRTRQQGPRAHESSGGTKRCLRGQSTCSVSDFLLLTTENFITKRFPGKSDVVEEPPWVRRVIPFHLHHLDSRDSFQPMLKDLLLSTDQFPPESAHFLSGQISGYLFFVTTAFLVAQNPRTRILKGPHWVLWQ